MAKSITLTLGYSGTTFKRNIKMENISDELENSAIVANIKAVNASLSGGTDGGLKEFFISDDYDATDSNNVIGELTGITAAAVDDVTVNPLNTAVEEDEGND